MSSFLRFSRASLAKRANEIALESRYGGAPHLTADSSVETLSRWLQWNDPNGAHTAARTRAEGFDPYTLDEAWDLIDEAVRSS